jgi:hypothetical protein
MAGARKLTLQIFGNAKSAIGALKDTGDATVNMGKRMSSALPSMKTMALATAAFGTAAAVTAKKFIDMGSSLQESLSKVDVVFGSSSKAVRDFAKSAAQNLGISEQAALEAAGTYGNLMQAFGVTQPMAQEMSTSLVGLAADLASFNNTSVDDAILALRSGLSGETEPLKRFGIAINDVRLKEEARALGLYDGAGALDITAKTQAAYALIMKDSTLAQGDFDRTSEGVANRQRILAAQFKDVSAQIGTALIPAFTSILGVVSTKVMPLLTDFSASLSTGGLAGGLDFIAEKIKTGFPIFAAAFADFIGKAAAYIRDTGLPMLGRAISSLGDALIGWVTPRIPMIIQAMKDFSMGLTKFLIGTALPALVTNVQRLGDKLVSWISLAARELPAQLVTFFGDLGKWLLSDGIPMLLGYAARLTGSLVKWLATLGGSLIVGLGGAIVALVAALPDLFVGFFKGLGNIAVGAVKFFISKFDDMKQALANIAIGAVNALIRAFNSIPLIPNIPEITIDTKKLGTQMGMTAKDLMQVNSKFESLGGAATVAAGATTTLDVAAAELGGTLDGGGGKGGGGAKKKLDDVVEKLKKYSDAVRNSVGAAKSATDATKAVTKARDDLSKATDKVTAAQTYFDQVVRGYGKGSKQANDAERERAKAARDSERAGYGLEGATQAVKTAEQALEDVRKNVDSTPAEIREAEIALAEAKLSVADAVDTQYDATVALQEAETLLTEVTYGAQEGSVTYKSALDELNEAKSKQVDATDRVTDAIDRETEAVRKLRDAEAELATVRGQTPAAVQAKVDSSGDVITGGGASSSGGGLFGSFMQAVNALHPNSAALRSDTPVVAARKQFPKLYDQYKKAGLALAKGGIVTRPVQALLGENGAEAVIPLNRSGVMGNTEINITVNAGMGTDGRAVGDDIVKALKQYERLNGYLPLTARAVV